MYVSQSRWIKTGAVVWVPIPQRLVQQVGDTAFRMIDECGDCVLFKRVVVQRPIHVPAYENRRSCLANQKLLIHDFAEGHADRRVPSSRGLSDGPLAAVRTPVCLVAQ